MQSCMRNSSDYSCCMEGDEALLTQSSSGQTLTQPGDCHKQWNAINWIVVGRPSQQAKRTMQDHAYISVPHGQRVYQKGVFCCGFFKLNFKKQAKNQPKLRAGLRHWHLIGKKKRNSLLGLWKWISCLPWWCFFRNWNKMFSITKQETFYDFFSPSLLALNCFWEKKIVRNKIWGNAQFLPSWEDILSRSTTAETEQAGQLCPSWTWWPTWLLLSWSPIMPYFKNVIQNKPYGKQKVCIVLNHFKGRSSVPCPRLFIKMYHLEVIM